MAEQWVGIDGEQRGFVAPVLEELSTLEGEVVDQLLGVRPKPREERHEVGANNDVDRIELQQIDASEDAAQVACINSAAWTRLGKALRGEGDAARFVGGEVGAWHWFARPLCALR